MTSDPSEQSSSQRSSWETTCLLIPREKWETGLSLTGFNHQVVGRQTDPRRYPLAYNLCGVLFSLVIVLNVSASYPEYETCVIFQSVPNVIYAQILHRCYRGMFNCASFAVLFLSVVFGSSWSGCMLEHVSFSSVYARFFYNLLN